jgi:hypothetical protein
MLVSFQLASKFPQALVGLLDNLEQLASDPSCFEVLVKIDSEDPHMQAVIAAEVPRRRCRLRPLVTPRRRGYEDLWEALNELFKLTDPAAYFVCNLNDEVRIRGQGWDDRLRRYVGLFPDHIFRLRTSRLKFRNYYDFWECGFAPENYAFFTKRWLDICGDWNPCFGPDSSQQYIAYYLGYANYPSIKQYNRDVPILDIEWDNEGVGLNLSPPDHRRRTAVNFRLWQRQVSHPMQQELYRRARLLQAHIIQAECASLCPIDIIDDRPRRTILLRDANDGALLDLLPYKLSRVGMFLRNVRRSARYTYFAGGGRDARNLLPISTIEYLILRYPSFRRFIESVSPRRRNRRSRDRLVARYVAFRRSARRLILRFVLRSRISARRLEKKNAIGRALIPTLRSLVVAVLRASKAVTAKFTDAAFIRSRNSEHPGRRGLLRGGRRLMRRTVRRAGIFAYAVLRRTKESVRSLTTPNVWRRNGNRIALALMDRDRRWLTIQDINRGRIAPTRNPWFNSEGEAVGGNEMEAQAPAGISRDLTLSDKSSDRPHLASVGAQARPFDDERQAAPGRTGAPA